MFRKVIKAKNIYIYRRISIKYSKVTYRDNLLYLYFEGMYEEGEEIYNDVTKWLKGDN